MHLPDDQRLGRVGDGTAGEHRLAGPDPVGADREMLVEVDAAPDRAPHGGVVDEERQRRMPDAVTHPNPSPVRFAAESLAETEAGQRVALHRRFVPAVDAANRGVGEGRRQMRQPVAIPGHRVLRQEHHHVAAGHLHRPIPAFGPGRFGDLDEAGQRKLAHDVPGPIGRSHIGAHDLERHLALAHDPMQDGAEGAAGVQGWDDYRDRERGIAHHAM